MRHVERVLHLRRGVGEDIRVGIGRGARHEAAVGEEVRRAPEELHLRRLHLLRKDVGDRADVAVRFRQRRALRRDVAVVEGEEGHAEQLEHLEGDIGLELRLLHRVAEPRPQEGRAAERIGAGPGEGVPVADGEAEVILHALAEDLPVRDRTSG